MALPTKLNASDVRNWARGKAKQSARQIAKGRGKKAAKPPVAPAKDPADDPDKAKQPAQQPPDDDGKSSTVTVTVHHGKAPATGNPETEPQDPMNHGGPGAPELDDDQAAMLGEGDEDDQDDGPASDIEDKLGDFAEVLEHRADELEELAQDVDGDLTGDEVDLATMREVQAAIPEDLRQDLVEHLSALSDDEISEFCQHLLETGKIEDADLMTGFLKAAKGESAGDKDDEDDDGDEDEEDPDEEDSDAADDDDDSEDEDDSDEDEDEDDGPPKKGKAPPFAKGKSGKPPKKGKAPPFAKGSK